MGMETFEGQYRRRTKQLRVDEKQLLVKNWRGLINETEMVAVSTGSKT